MILFTIKYKNFCSLHMWNEQGSNASGRCPRRGAKPPTSKSCNYRSKGHLTLGETILQEQPQILKEQFSLWLIRLPFRTSLLLNISSAEPASYTWFTHVLLFLAAAFLFSTGVKLLSFARWRVRPFVPGLLNYHGTQHLKEPKGGKPCLCLSNIWEQNEYLFKIQGKVSYHFAKAQIQNRKRKSAFLFMWCCKEAICSEADTMN